MSKGGFLRHDRFVAPRRPVEERLGDWGELEGALTPRQLEEQGERCMGCGVPFCHGGCPLGNRIPDFNELVAEGRLEEAARELHATNNFPEVTGRVCPAPCEQACVLNLSEAPVTIEQIERHIAERAFEEGWVRPQIAAASTGKRVAVVGSGPAGLACAQQLARAGHQVTVYERAERPGGLLRYGIPDFKLDKGVIDRRLAQLEAEGVVFRTGVEVGTDVPVSEIRAYDAVVLATGSTTPRDLPLPGRALAGIHPAMTYLGQQNRALQGQAVPDRIDAAGKAVLVIGGGDTGSDCVGTALRQGARSVHQLEILPRPPSQRTADMPWPWWPQVFRVSSSHEEGGERLFSFRSVAFEGEGRVAGLRGVRIERRPDGFVDVPGSEEVLPAELVLLALGFVGVEGDNPLYDGLGVRLARGRIEGRFQTDASGVFACGDARRGQSLVVWAIWEGREAAREVDAWLRQGRSRLPTVPMPLEASP